MPFDVEAFVARFRKRLRDEREERVGSRERLAELAGVNKATIQKIETGPDMPQIDTIAKLIAAMPGASLASFFDADDELQSSSLRKEAATTENPPFTQSSVTGGPHGAEPDSPDDQRRADRLAQALVDFVRAELAKSHRPPAGTRPARPKGRRRVRRRRSQSS